MSIRQRVISGLNRLSEIARQSFGQPSAGETAPAPTPEEDLSHTLSFPTGGQRQPFEINVKLFKLPAPWGDQSWRIIIATHNARHPYDKTCEHGYFGKEVMNPALLTALGKTEAVIADAADRELGTAPFKGGNVYYSTTDGGKPKVEGAMDGATFWVTFNDSTREGKMRTVKHADIVSLYKSMISALEQARPDIQKHIDQSAVLQPAATPSSEELMFFHANIDGAAANALSRALEKAGHNPNTVFVVDGKHRRFIKGMEP